MKGFSFVRKYPPLLHFDNFIFVHQAHIRPAGDNDTSSDGPHKWRENAHPRLRKNVGGFYDACLPAGCLMHFLSSRDHGLEGGLFLLIKSQNDTFQSVPVLLYGTKTF